MGILLILALIILGTIISFVLIKFQKAKEIFIGICCLSLFVFFIGGWQALASVILLLIFPILICTISLKSDDNLFFSIFITTIAYFIGFLLLFALEKWVFNVDLLQSYYKIVDEVQRLFLETFENERKLQLELKQTNEIQLLEDYYYQIKTVMDIVFYKVKYLFMGMLFIFCFVISFVQILNIGFWGRVFGIITLNFKQLLNFKVPRSIPFIFIISYLAEGYTNENLEVLSALVSNIVVVAGFVLGVIGVGVVISLLNSYKKSIKFKVLLIILFILALLINPYIFLLIGFIEGVFRFRRPKENKNL